MAGVIVNVWLSPWDTVTLPEGEIVPPVPAVALIVYVFVVNVADIV
jgi:hypothetical protein